MYLDQLVLRDAADQADALARSLQTLYDIVTDPRVRPQVEACFPLGVLSIDDARRALADARLRE